MIRRFTALSSSAMALQNGSPCITHMPPPSHGSSTPDNPSARATSSALALGAASDDVWNQRFTSELHCVPNAAVGRS